MPSPATSWAALAGFAATLTPSGAPAQPPPQAPSTIYAMLEDPAGNPVPDATGWLLLEPSQRLAALPSPLPVGRGQTTSTWTEATSDQRGLLRFVGGASRPGAGSGLVTTTAGLGAILPRLFARRLQQVTLEPMAEISTPNGSEPFTLYARARLADGHRVIMPRRRGARVRLPAGDYEVWAQSEDGWIWQRLQLRSGARAEVRFEGAAQRLQLTEDAYLHPAGWTSVNLGAGGEGLDVLLRGRALDAALVTWTDRAVTPPLLAPKKRSPAALRWPPTTDGPKTSYAAGIADATWFGLTRLASGSFQLIARAVADETGAVTLPAPPGGDSWLLAVGDFAPVALPWSGPSDLTPVAAARGVDLRIQVRNRHRRPAVDVVCRYVPDGMPAAAVVARTDATGSADFGACRGPGALYIEDQRFANQVLRLGTVPTRELPVAVSRGEQCSGTVTFADGASAGTVVLTLRDPTGTLQPATRTRTLQAGDEFVFEGLPPTGDFVLFATALRQQRTWSARAIARPGEAGVTLTLTDEDPEFGR